MVAFLYEFEWDPGKARTNFTKHGVHFERATQVFRDSLALSIPDEEHDEIEVRWITLGRDASGQYVLVVHTFVPVNHEIGRVRLISARTPTRTEIHVTRKNDETRIRFH